MFGVMLQKLWHKKWMAFSLLVGITLLALVIYVFLLKKIGYIIDTFILCFFVIRSLGYKKTGVTLLCSALAVACVFFIFKVLLSVPLPMILLDF